jgi:hypothetical protein
MMEDTKQRLIQIESGGRPLASYLSAEAISEVLALISDCEQAAELRTLEALSFDLDADEIVVTIDGKTFTVTESLATLQATKPEKG